MWRNVVYEHLVVVRWVIRRLFALRRTKAASVAEYDEKWLKKDFFVGHAELHVKHGRFVLLRRLERTRHVVKRINEAISYAHPESVIEFGCGLGTNVVALALLNNAPGRSMRFTGIDLSDNGLAAARKLLQDPPIFHFSRITGLSEEEIRSRLPLIQNRVEFKKCDMLATGLPGASFGFAYTHVAIEQLPRDYGKAFAEVFRLLTPGGQALFIEEFKEAQDSLLRQLNVWAQDYFHMPVKEITSFGFTIAQYEPAEYQKYRLGTGVLLVEKPLP